MEKAFIMRNNRAIGMDVQRVYTSTPVGIIQPFASDTNIPRGYLLCDGASYAVAEYPDLYAVIGNTYGGDTENFNVPDYRETVLVGVGENTTDTIASHDVYELGEFKDDQLQGHWHNLGNSNGIVTVSLGASIKGSETKSAASDQSMTRYLVDTALDAITDGTNGEPRRGTTTHGKQKGVTYIIKAFHTNEGTDEGVSDDVIEYVEGEIAEVENKIKGSVTHSFNTQDGKVKYLKLKLNANTISIVDIYGGKIEILGANNSVANPDYKTVKVVRHSYGNWSSYDATQVPSVVSTKIGNLYYYPTDNYYYLQLNNYANFTVTGATTIPELVASLPVATSEMTLIPESKFVSKDDLLAQTANRQVKTFDNTGSSAEKWCKICSAITGGIGCNIKLTASRADSTATVQYFSALFRDNRYRYTSTCLTRERTVYESMLTAEYSAYIIADANNDIWVHVPSYGKAIIEIDTRAITIDGTIGTPVEDYVYSSFEHQYDGKIVDTETNSVSTWSSSKIAQQINNATAIKYDNVINANATKETDWSLAQGESHFYGRLLQLDGHLGSKSSTFSFLLFVKANYDNPTTVYVTQLAGMDDDRTNIAHTTYFELGVSSSGNLTIKNKSAVVASYRFI